MTMPRKRFSFRDILPVAALVLGSLGSANAAAPKTLMILVDFWGQRSQMDTIINLKVFQPSSEIKMVNGQTPPNPVLADAYVKEKFAWWYALPNFLADDYQKGRIRINTQYLRGWFQNDSTYRAKAGDTIFLPDTQMSFTYQNALTGQTVTVGIGTTTPKIFVFPDTAMYRGRKLYYAPGNSETEILNSRTITSSNEILPGRIDSCIDLFHTDTIWIRWGTPSIPPGQAPQEKALKCFDHNPFNRTRGTVAVFSPWSGSAGWAVVNGITEPLQASARAGWMQADIWTPPSDSSEALVKFRFERSSGEIGTVDSSGGPYHINSGTSIVSHVVPAMGAHPGFHQSQLQDSVVFAWTNPWQTRIAELHFGGEERLRGIWHPEGWFTAMIWGRPTKAGLVSSGGDSTTPMLDIITATPGKFDTIWLTPKPTGGFISRLEGTAYDYRLGNHEIPPVAPYAPIDSSAYFPFSQTTNSDLIQGLVKNHLGRDGRPHWTGKPICGMALSYLKSKTIDTTGCKDSANAMEKWFGAVVQGGKAMNATFPVSMELSSIKEGALAYKDTLYFPLDTFTKLPGTNAPNPFNDSLVGRDFKKHNFGYCIELHGQAQLSSGSKLTIESDDDTWIFLDSQLVVDLGGQHSSLSRTVSVDRIASPLPPLVSIDIFHCERHIDESSMLLSMNFPVYPVGAKKVPPRVSSHRPGIVARKQLSLQSHHKVLSVTASAGQSWSLELRGLDGKLQKAVSGTGAAMIPLTFSGITIARLRSGAESVTGRFVAAR